MSRRGETDLKRCSKTTEIGLRSYVYWEKMMGIVDCVDRYQTVRGVLPGRMPLLEKLGSWRREYGKMTSEAREVSADAARREAERVP
jgi:hypothetical protein